MCMGWLRSGVVIWTGPGNFERDRSDLLTSTGTVLTSRKNSSEIVTCTVPVP
jgi:hypothetical protein